MTDQIIQRASLLIQHRRYEDAQKELRNVLAGEPNHPFAHALLGVSSTELGRHDEALQHIRTALGQQPDNPYFHYLEGLVLTRKGDLKGGFTSVMTAVTFDPHNADYYGLLAVIKLDEKDWKEALMFANRGLQADPENLVCLNTRSTALLKLDRKDESYQTIKEALHNDPHNAHTHANLGWGLLEKGDHKQALESFREALKLDPENQYAKAGLVEALKARYWFYRMFLQYVFWMTNMNAKYQWVFVLGLWFGIRILNSISESNPDMAPFIKPVIYLYSAFAISTWVVTPLSNLFLRLNVYGRYALTRDQTKASTFTGIGFALTLAGAVGYFITDGFPYLGMIFYGIGFMILCGSMFKPKEPRKRMIAMVLAGALCVLGAMWLLIELTGGNGGALLMIFVYGTIAYQFLINALNT